MIPSALAENPRITVPRPDPSGPGASADALQAAAASLAQGAPAHAQGAIDAALAACAAPSTPEGVFDCVLVFPGQEAAAALGFAFAGLGQALAAGDGVQATPDVLVAILSTKQAEAMAVHESATDVVAPALGDGVGTLQAAVHAHVCAYDPAAVPPAGAPSCGQGSLLGRTLAGADLLYAGTLALVGAVDGVAACESFDRALATTLPQATDALACSDLPHGGLLVAALPPRLG